MHPFSVLDRLGLGMLREACERKCREKHGRTDEGDATAAKPDETPPAADAPPIEGDGAKDGRKDS